MRIATLTLTGLLFASSAAFAQTPWQQLQQDNAGIQQLDTDIRNNARDLSTDQQVAADQRLDLARDQADARADQLREDQDLDHGNYKGAAFWNSQRLREDGKATVERKDLTHTYQDISADRGRLLHDIHVRQVDVARRNRAVGKR